MNSTENTHDGGDQHAPDGTRSSPAPAQLTIISSIRPSVVTKRYRLRGGELLKDVSANITKARAKIVTVGDLAELGSVLEGLQPSECVTFGLPVNPDAMIVTIDEWVSLGKPADKITRSRDHFAWPAGPGVWMSDYDAPKKGEEEGRPMARDELVDAVRKVCPGLADVAMAWRPSASSCIIDGSTGRELRGIAGQRIYIIVQDAADIPRAAKALNVYMWAAGYGDYAVSSAGNLMKRGLFDDGVAQPERIDFAAGAVVAPPLVQDRGPTQIIPGSVVVVDTRQAVPEPDEATVRRADAAMARAKAAKQPKAQARKAAYVAQRVPAMAAQIKAVHGYSDEVARVQAAEAVRQVLECETLTADFEIEVEDGNAIVRVTVGEILANAGKWHGKLCRDPVEPDYRDGYLVGKIFTDNPPNINSFAHGGRQYKLLKLEPWVAELNREFFVAPDEAGQPTIFRERIDMANGRPTLTAITPEKFKLLYENRFVEVPTGSANEHGEMKTARRPMADMWRKSRNRREYLDGVALLPHCDAPKTVYNLWRGFTVEPAAGDVAPILEHVRMMCDGDEAAFKYLMGWLAFCVQKPAERPEVAVVARGGKGAGKGTLFRLMRELFGHHAMQIMDGRMLTGTFNGHLRSALFVFVDEGFWAGDKAGESILKGLVTEPTLTIHGKGKEAFEAENRLKIAFAANEAWVVPASADERRYFVIDVPGDRKGDHPYFTKLNAWVDGGGRSAWLHHLLTMDLSGFNQRQPPSTKGLDRQKIESMSAFDRWMLECLEAGVTPEAEGLTGQIRAWNEVSEQRVIPARVVEGYQTYVKQSGTKWAAGMDKRDIGARLRQLMGREGYKRFARSARVGTGVMDAWHLPDLFTARDAALKTLGLKHHEWEIPVPSMCKAADGEM